MTVIYSAAGSPFRQLIEALNARRRVAEDFMRRRNVIGCGVGYKIMGEAQTIIPCVMVSVTRKQPLATLDPSDIIPGTVDDVPTDVVEIGEVEALGLNRMAEQRPLRPGLSIAHFQGTAGTLGCLVRRGSDRFILSNNHVLALLDRGRPGDPILQPGPRDGGTLNDDKVAELADILRLQLLDEGTTQPPSSGGSFLELLRRVFGGRIGHTRPTSIRQPNRADAALARPMAGIALSPEIIDAGGPPRGLTPPHLGMRVMKSGRTTGLTQGRVMQIDVTIDVKYDGRPARFTDQIVLSPMSQPGDSGSLVLDYERNAVALLFSGSDSVSIATPIQTVLSALQVELITGD